MASRLNPYLNFDGNAAQGRLSPAAPDLNAHGMRAVVSGAMNQQPAHRWRAIGGRLRFVERFVAGCFPPAVGGAADGRQPVGPVSYTHLTLQTSDLV